MEQNVRKEAKHHPKKSDPINQIVEQYLQRRNYPPLVCKETSYDEFLLRNRVDGALSRANSILFSCINNDPIAIDHVFVKFINWLKGLRETREQIGHDLQVLLAPLFCHIYLQILRGGHADKASGFLKRHITVVEECNRDNDLKELIGVFECDLSDTTAYAKIEHFRLNRYLVRLSGVAIELLKAFLNECEHVILLQVFQNWFLIEEDEEEEEMMMTETQLKRRQLKKKGHHCNGNSKTDHHNHHNNYKGLLDSIDAVRNEPYPLVEYNLNNVRNPVTCGKLNRANGCVAYAYSNTVWLRPLRTLEQLNRTVVEVGEVPLRGHSGRIYDLAFMDRYLISAGGDRTLRLYDLNNFDTKHVYVGHEYAVFCVAASRTNVLFASGGYDRSVQVFSAETGTRLRWCAGHAQEVTCVQFHPNAAFVGAGSADKTIRMFAINDGETARLLIGSKGTVYAICFAPSGRYLLSGGDDHRLRIWDLNSARQLAAIAHGTETITQIAISDDEQTVATGTSEGVIRLWDFNAVVGNQQQQPQEEDNENLQPSQMFRLTNRLCSLDFQLEGFGCLTSEDLHVNNH